MATKVKRPWAIVRMGDSGQWETIARFKTEQAADNRIDSYSNRYPYAWLDIIKTN